MGREVRAETGKKLSIDMSRSAPALMDLGSSVYRPRQLWADVVRVAAVVMIFLYHFTGDWSTSAGTQQGVVERFIEAHFAGWAIAGFVVLSGFSLGLTRFLATSDTRVYLSRRLTRILSPYWTIALPFAIAGFVLGEAPFSDLWKFPVWLLGLGFVSQATYEPISEAWWYVSLALQISLILPVLVRTARRIGLLPLTAIALALNAAALAAVDAAGSSWGYLAQGLVLCRLTEVMIGIGAAHLVLWRGDIRRLGAALASIALVVVISPVLDMLGLWTGWGATAVLGGLFGFCALFASGFTNSFRILSWAAALSYCFYLTHAPVSKYTGRLLAELGLETTIVALPLILAVCVFVAWVFDWFARRYVTPRLSSVFDRILVRSRGTRP